MKIDALLKSNIRVKGHLTMVRLGLLEMYVA